eukprot:1007069-Prorocentrum_minimum.AAC.4
MGGHILIRTHMGDIKGFFALRLEDHVQRLTSALAQAVENRILELLVLTCCWPVTQVLLREDAAPKTCEAIRTLASSGAYNGCCFYRAEPGFGERRLQRKRNSHV